MRQGGMNNKSLSSLPKPILWNPKSGCDSLAKKWLKSLIDYCDLLNWPLPTIFGHFMEGTAVEWWTPLVKRCDIDLVSLNVDLISKKILAQYATGLISGKNLARMKLFNNQVSMATHPDYLQFELAFQACMLDCEDLSMSDQIMWFCKGLTPALHIVVGMQPITNKEWEHITPLMEFTRGHVARTKTFSSPSSLTPALNFHRADTSPAPSSQPFEKASWTKVAGKDRRPVQEQQGNKKKQAVNKPGAGESSGKGGGAGDQSEAQFLANGALNPKWVSDTQVNDRLSKICQEYSEDMGYRHASSIPRAKITVIRMRADGACPRCHVWGHVDVDVKGKTICTAPSIVADWPLGGYTRNGKGGLNWPAPLGKMVGLAWQLKHKK